jgi:hypothetical protein
MGVARNPLRDGAPPTGFAFEHFPHFRDAVVHRGQVHEALAVLHRTSGQRCTTWAAVCRLLRPIDQPLRSAQDGRQTSAFVKALQSISQRRFSRAIVGFSSRGSSSNEALTSFTRCTAGRVSPHASLVDYNLTRVETGRVSHDALLERPKLAQPLPLASCHHRPEPRRKAAVQKSRLRPNAAGVSTRERPRYPSDQKRVWMLEAPGDAPPLPPSGWARTANGSTVTKPGPRLFSARRVARG